MAMNGGLPNNYVSWMINKDVGVSVEKNRQGYAAAKGRSIVGRRMRPELFL